MPRGALIGRLFGTDIYATGGFLMIMVLFLIVAENVYAVAAFEIALIISVLVHEFGHVFAVKKFTGKSSVVLLWGLGGLCVHEPTPVIRQRIGISLMGPAFGFVLGGLCWLAAWLLLPDKAHPAIAAFANAMILINVYYTALNLLPVLPMDGGHATLAALELKLPGAKALALTRRISVLFGAVGIGLGIYLKFDILVLIMAFFVFQNVVAARHGV